MPRRSPFNMDEGIQNPRKFQRPLFNQILPSKQRMGPSTPTIKPIKTPPHSFIRSTTTSPRNTWSDEELEASSTSRQDDPESRSPSPLVLSTSIGRMKSLGHGYPSAIDENHIPVQSLHYDGDVSEQSSLNVDASINVHHYGRGDPLSPPKPPFRQLVNAWKARPLEPQHSSILSFPLPPRTNAQDLPRYHPSRFPKHMASSTFRSDSPLSFHSSSSSQPLRSQSIDEIFEDDMFIPGIQDPREFVLAGEGSISDVGLLVQYANELEKGKYKQSFL